MRRDLAKKAVFRRVRESRRRHKRRSAIHGVEMVTMRQRPDEPSLIGARRRRRLRAERYKDRRKRKTCTEDVWDVERRFARHWAHSRSRSPLWDYIATSIHR